MDYATLNFRNAVKYDDYIDCEIEHPEFGWIPFAAKADDVGAGADLFIVLDAPGNAKAATPAERSKRAPTLPPVAPCSMVQFKLALHRAGKLEAANAYVANASVEFGIWWSHETVLNRDHAMTDALLRALGTQAAANKLFADALVVIP